MSKINDLTKKKPAKGVEPKKHTAKYLVNKAIGKHLPGQIILVDVDKNGVPLEKYMRRRLKDAKRDNCIELVIPAKKNKIKTKPEGE